MLILTRKKGQTFTIHLPGGETIVFTLASASHNTARIGVDAPKTISIVRDDAIVRKPPGDVTWHKK